MIFLNLFFTALITEIQITERVLWHPMACVPSCVLRLCGVVRRSVALKMRHSDIKKYQKHVLILIREIGKDPQDITRRCKTPWDAARTVRLHSVSSCDVTWCPVAL